MAREIGDGATPPGIDLEVTESRLMDDVEGNIEKLKDVRARGLGVAIDDFGTGHSSLAYVARLPVDTVKIDRSFVIRILVDANVMTLVSTIVSMAQSLRLKVVAEGVESEDQAAALQRLGCEGMQGYSEERTDAPTAQGDAVAIEVLCMALRTTKQNAPHLGR